MKTNALLLYLVIAACAYAKQGITDWMATYYLSADDSQLAAFWDKTVAKGALELPSASRELLIGFSGAVMRTHPDFLRSRVTTISQFPEKQRDGICIILWLSQTEHGRKLLAAEGHADMATAPCPPIGNRRLLADEDVNFLEGWYWATGDTDSLEPFLRCIASDENKAEFAAGALREICSRDERAQQFVRRSTKEERFTGRSREIIEAVLGKDGANQPLQRTPDTKPIPSAASDSRRR